MAVKLRLTRMGAKKAPFYRIVAIDSKKSRDGQYLEQIGYYNPVSVPSELKIDKDVAQKWLDMGAIPTDTVRDMLYNAGVLVRPKKQNYSKKAAAETTASAVDLAVKAATSDEK
jgi:small subunit ribosomal protein S16